MAPGKGRDDSGLLHPLFPKEGQPKVHFIRTHWATSIRRGSIHLNLSKPKSLNKASNRASLSCSGFGPDAASLLFLIEPMG